LLLGLRQPSAWTALRPRAVSVAIERLRAAFATVVCDCDAEVEGQAETGSRDVEDRNALARAAIGEADVVFVVGRTGLKGTYSLARTIGCIADFGVAPTRVVPIFNGARSGPRQRARMARVLAELVTDDVRTELAMPIFVPDRDVDAALHDRRRLPSAVGDPLVGAFHAVLRHAGKKPGRSSATPPMRIVPGSLDVLGEPVDAS
jgi:hypothetical protein